MKKLLDYVRLHKLATLLVFVGIVAGVYSAFFAAEDATPTAPERRIVSVERGTLAVSVTGSGQVAARSQVDLKSVRAGDGVDVIAVPVKNDQAVKRGQVIAVLDGADVARSLAQARLNLRSAEIKLKQTEDLYDTKTKGDLWNRQLQEIAVAQGRLSLEDAAERLADYTIKAPFGGIVTGLTVSAGDSLSNETVLASVITSDMQVNISLNEVDAAQVEVGSAVQLSFDALPGVTLTGSVSKLDTIGVATQGVISYGAEITLDEQHPKLKPGMSVAAEIAVAKRENAILVPNEAIVTEKGESFVRVVGGNARVSGRTENETGMAAFEKRVVSRGLTDNVQTEIVSGLAGGEQLVVIKQAVRTSSTASQAQGNWLGNFLRGGNRAPGSR